jgi:hypothetical protein
MPSAWMVNATVSGTARVNANARQANIPIGAPVGAVVGEVGKGRAVENDGAGTDLAADGADSYRSPRSAAGAA